ncbi:MAG: hypothetical protein ACQET5_12515 [Halobacteriota archaeon]
MTAFDVRRRVPRLWLPVRASVLNRRRSVSFPENDGSRYCFVLDDGAVHLFRH